MRGVFDDKGLEEAAPRQDTELTLGFTTLILIFFGLVLLCGLCFALGYTTGHHGAQETSAALASAGGSGQTTAQEDNGPPKPSANPQADAVTQPSAAAEEPESAESSPAADQPDSAGSNPAGASVQSSAVAAAGSPSSGPMQVKPAFGTTANPVQPGQPAASAVGPALGPPPVPAGSLMVQIAAVSEQEDADVLMSALRKRGYAVGSHREPLDGLIHVQIGPFKTRDEADKWRQKLLNDGYNAIEQP